MKEKKSLSTAEFRKRASAISLVLTDNDGVLTDAGVYYNEHGEAFKRFSIRDGMGVELLRQAGIETAIMTSELSPSVRRRAEKLRMRYLYLGIKDKKGYLPSLLKEIQLKPTQLAYIGDDVNDLEILEAIGKSGLIGSPADAIPEVRKIVHYCSKARGGNGAFREFAEWILRLRKK